MTSVFCSIIVTVCMADCTFGIESRVNAKGKIMNSSTSKYLVDFSKEAKNNDWLGDYSNVLVEKSECVKVK